MWIYAGRSSLLRPVMGLVRLGALPRFAVAVLRFWAAIHLLPAL
jgi:hypothetical protein